MYKEYIRLVIMIVYKHTKYFKHRLYKLKIPFFVVFSNLTWLKQTWFPVIFHNYLLLL